MKIFGKVVGIKGETITLEVDDTSAIRRIITLSDGAQPTLEVNIRDEREISPEQRKFVYALIRDIANWSGHFPDEIKNYAKFEFEEITELEISLSDCSREEATEFINYLLKFVITNKVPLPKGIKVLDENLSYYLYLCLINRACAVCGKSGADIDHYNEAVGMGRNRKTIDQSQMTFCALCRTHHQERHQIGARAFSEKYHVDGIRLNSEKRKKLWLGG